MVNILCDIIIDFQTTEPERDITIAHSILEGFEKLFNLPTGSFQLGSINQIPMGWSVVKIFLSLELAQKLYENNSYEIDNNSDENGRSGKFLSWLNMVFSQKGCNARLKYAEDMKNTSGGHQYSSQFVTIFSDEFHWSR
jgi:hypothetical protein